MIGVGNALRGDDGAGLEVARRLRGEPGIEVLIHEGEGWDLLELWSGAGTVVLIDTVRSGAAPGTIVRFDAGSRPLPGTLWRRAGHAVGVAEAIELARTLGRLPGRLVVLGVEGEQFETGGPVSPAVQAAIEPLLTAVRSEALVSR